MWPFNRRARSNEHPSVQEPEVAVPAVMCDICGDVARTGARRCIRHMGAVLGTSTEHGKETRDGGVA